MLLGDALTRKADEGHVAAESRLEPTQPSALALALTLALALAATALLAASAAALSNPAKPSPDCNMFAMNSAPVRVLLLWPMASTCNMCMHMCMHM